MREEAGQEAGQEGEAGTGGLGDCRVTGPGQPLLLLYDRSLLRPAGVSRPDHHPGRLERVVPQPELPDDAPVVAVVSVYREVLSVQVCLKTTEKTN